MTLAGLFVDLSSEVFKNLSASVLQTFFDRFTIVSPVAGIPTSKQTMSLRIVVHVAHTYLHDFRAI